MIQFATGRKTRVLIVIDAFSRFSPAIDARSAYRGENVVRPAGASFIQGRSGLIRAASSCRPISTCEPISTT